MVRGLGADHDYGTLYDGFKSAMAAGQFDQLNFTELRTHFGQNPGNQLNSPLWIHMVAGLGTGLFLFDDKGGAVNPLDQNSNRYGIFADAEQNVTVAPATAFDPDTFMSRVAFNLDCIVRPDGRPTGSSNHPLITPLTGPNLREGAPNQNMAGPLRASLIDRLTNPDPAVGIVLDAWLNANGETAGAASDIVK
ncbi:MAG: hypothetical protein ACYTGV_10960 [Planctomycetota bacterium]